MEYVVTSAGKPDYFEDRVSVGDVVKYELDFSPWLEGKGSISDTEWTVHSGSVSVDEDDQSALITFSNAGKALVSCVVTTSTGEAKKIWLILKAIDRKGIDDYGFGDGS